MPPLPSSNLLKSNWKTMKLEGKDHTYKLEVNAEHNGYEMLFFNFGEFKMYFLKQNDQDIQKLFRVNFKFIFEFNL